MPFLAPVIGFIGSAAASIGSFIGGLGVIGKLVLSIGLSVASSLVQKAMAKKNKQVSQPGGVQFEKQYGAEVARTVPIGLVGIAGHDAYINTYGAANGLLQQIYVVGDYPCDGLNRVAIDGEWVTFGPSADPDKGYPVTSGEYANLIWVKFFDGTQTLADDYLVDNANPVGRWTVNHIGVGIPFVSVSMTYEAERNASTHDFFFEVRGARLYDWRKDSTVGGVGAHRWDDPSTHEFSENPILADRHYRRGFAINGDVFCGMAMDSSDLPLTEYTAAANVCDEDVGGSPRYRVSLILDAMTTHADNIESLMLSCGGMVIDGIEGSWPLVGTDQAVVATLTDDDMIVGAPVRYQDKRSMSELVNAIGGNFPDPDQIWAMIPYEAQIDAAAVVLDRRTRDLNADFPMVRHGPQAEQLASIYLKENRFEASATITVRPRWQGLQPGDWINWNSARYGLKTFIVVEALLYSLESDGPRNVQLTLQQRDGSIYDGITPSVIVVPTPPGAPALLSEVVDFALLAVIVEGDDGAQQAGIRASWDAIDDPTVVAVQLKYFSTAEPTQIFYKTVPVDVTVVILTEGVVKLTEYTVQPKLVTLPERVTIYAVGATVTTTDIVSDIFPIDREDLGDDINDYLDFAGQNARDVINELRALAAIVASQDTSSYADRREIRRELRSEVNGVTASYVEAITVATGPGSALSMRIETLEVALPGLATVSAVDLLTTRVTSAEGDIDANATAITSLTVTVAGKADASALTALEAEVTSIDGVVTAQGSAITAIDSEVDGFSASGLFRTEVVSTRAGAQATIGISVAATGGGATKTASIFLDALASGLSRVVIVADQFIATDGTNNASPFVFTGGVLYLQNLVVGNAVIGTGAVTSTKSAPLEFAMVA